MPIQHEPICIGENRWKLGASVAFVGAMAALVLAWGVAAGNVAYVAIALVVCVPPTILGATRLLRRGPALRLDDDALQEARSGQVVRWADVQDAYVRRRQSLFDEHHELVIVTRQADRREISLDGLTMPWERIVSLLEERLDREVPVRRERAPLR